MLKSRNRPLINHKFLEPAVQSRELLFFSGEKEIGILINEYNFVSYSTSPVPLIPRKKGKKRVHSESDEEVVINTAKKKLKRKEKKERKKLEKALASVSSS